MSSIVNMKDYSGGIEKAVKFYHQQWGKAKNHAFFRDAIHNSTNSKIGLPRFYLLLDENNIVGCCGLIVNDFVSRHDLLPWLCGLFVDESYRGNGFGNRMMQHVEQEAKVAGYPNLYLTTGLDGYYEKYGWHRIEDGYFFTEIYAKTL